MNKTYKSAAALLVLVLAVQMPAMAAGEWLMDTLNDAYFWLVMMGIVLLGVALFAVNHAFNTISKQFAKPKSAEEAAAEEVKPAGILAALTDATPVEKEADILLDHDYDGIKELDNNLPPWWKWGFYISIVYAVVYLLIYHVFNIVPSSSERWENEMASAQEQIDRYMATAANLIDENSVTLLEDEGRLKNGKKIYDLNCVACHAADGGGLVGPNLTDEYWIHGGSINSVFAVIKNGVIEKGMIPWKTQLSPAEMQDVASYVLTLQGTTPANPKAAEGEKYVPEAPEAAADEDPTDAENAEEEASEEESVSEEGTEVAVVTP